MPTAAPPPRVCLCRHGETAHNLTPAGIRTACSVATGPVLAVCGCRRFRTHRPVVLLDVDEVVNAVRPGRTVKWPPARVWPGSDWVCTPVRTGRDVYQITAARPVLDMLTTVHDLGVAEIRWHTSWQEHAPTALAPALGLPDFPVQDRCGAEVTYPLMPRRWADRDPDLAGWWKLPAAIQVVNEGRPLLWLDDDLDVFRDQVEASPVGQHRDRLLIAPTLGVGLTPRHLARIIEFLARGFPDPTLPTPTTWTKT